MSNIVVTIGKDIELGAEDLLKFVTKGSSKVQGAGPTVIAGLGALAAGVEQALKDVATSAANPASLIINLGSDINDFKAAWGDVKTFLAALGVKV